MKKFLVVVGVVAALVIPASAIAVDLQGSHVGLGCSGDGTFHFVANQTGGAVGTLDVDFSGGGDVNDMAPTFWNNGTNHWIIDANGTIISASATVGGKLVLSDFSCDAKKK